MNKKLLSLIAIFLIIISAYYLIRVIPYLLEIVDFTFSILTPFFYSFIIAFLLAPLVDRFERYGRNRLLAVFIVYIFLIVGVIFVFINLIPVLIDQVELLIENIPSLVDGLRNLIDKLRIYLTFLPDDIEPEFENYSNILSSLVVFVYDWIGNSFTGLFSSITVIILIPVITAYLLYDYNKIKRGIKLYLLKKNKIKIKKYLETISKSLGMYVRGLFLVMLILSIMSAVGFALIGLDYYLFFALIVGLTNAIPIFGAYLGGCFPVIYALSVSPNKAILVLVIIVILQFIESSIVTPFIQSKNMKMHPLTIIFGILLFGKLFGLIGVLFAVPLLTLVKISYKFLKKNPEPQEKVEVTE